jgi:hypothetical protein
MIAAKRQPRWLDVPANMIGDFVGSVLGAGGSDAGRSVGWLLPPTNANCVRQ